MTNRRRLIVGLGNPGTEYALTRHNLGARVLLELRACLRSEPFRASRALCSKTSQGSHLLAIPTKYMNDSGQAVSALLKNQRFPLHRLLVVHDDKDLVFGTIRLQKGRSSAGHRGVESIIDSLGSNQFWRLRIGVGAPPKETPTDAYVLETFTRDEERELTFDVIPRSVEHLQAWLDHSLKTQTQTFSRGLASTTKNVKI